MQTGSDNEMNETEESNKKHRKRRRASSSRARPIPRANIYDVVAGRVTVSGILPRYRYANPNDLFSTAISRGLGDAEDVDHGSTRKRVRRHSHSVTWNQFAPTNQYRDMASFSHDPLTPYNWLFNDIHAPSDDPARSLWSAVDWLTDEGGFDKWARSRGTLPSGSVYNQPAAETVITRRPRLNREDTHLNNSTAALTLREGKSQVEVYSDHDTEEGEGSSFGIGSLVDNPQAPPKELHTGQNSQLRETWSLPAHEELTGPQLSLEKATKLPSSDLLKAIHAYASDVFTALYRPADPPCHGCMDETALLAFGILMEELVAAEVDGRESEFVEPDSSDSEGNTDAESMENSGEASTESSRAGSTTMRTDEDTRPEQPARRTANVVVVIPPVPRNSSPAASLSSGEL